MKKTIALLTACILLTGCVRQSSEISAVSESSAELYDPFDFSETDHETVDASYGFGLCVPPEDHMIPFADTVDLRFFIDNAGNDADFALFMFADGILQQVQTDGAKAYTESARLTVKKDERREFSVSFCPNLSADSESHTLTYAIMYDPGFTPDSPTTVFGNHQRVSAVTAFAISGGNGKASAFSQAEIKPISVDLRKQYEQYDDSGNPAGNVLDTEPVLLTGKVNVPENDPAPNAVAREDTLCIRLMGGIRNEQYRICAFCGGKQLSVFDGKPYLDMTADRDTLSEYMLPLQTLPRQEVPYSALYFMAIPLRDTGCFMKSHSLVFAENTEQHTLSESLTANPGWIPYYEIAPGQVLTVDTLDAAPHAAILDIAAGTMSEAIQLDMLPQCRENGFWVLHGAEKESGAMRWFGQRPDYADQLLFYGYDLKQQYCIDLTNWGDVYAMDADPKQNCIVRQDSVHDGTVWKNRLISCDMQGENEKLLYESTQKPGAFAGCTALYLYDRFLYFSGFVYPAGTGENLTAWGICSVDSGKMELVTDSDSSFFLLPDYQGVTVYTYDDETKPPKWSLCRVENGVQTPMTVNDPRELYYLMCCISADGSYFSTVMRGKTGEGGKLYRLTVYDRSGNTVLCDDLKMAAEDINDLNAVFLCAAERAIYVRIYHAGSDVEWRRLSWN